MRMSTAELTTVTSVRQIVQERELLRNNLSPFIAKTFSTVDQGTVFKPNWHIDCIAEHCEALTIHNQIQRLIVNVPPRMTKSTCMSIALPAWLFGQDPSWRILAASGVQKLATRFSDSTRKVMDAGWYRATFPYTRLRPGQNEKMRFETISGGHRISVSVGSSVIGEGGRLQIIDDPIDPDSAFSLAELEAVIRWYNNTWITRADNPEVSLELLVMQRTNRKDLTQHLLDMGGWYHLKLPNEAPTQILMKYPISGKEVIREEGEFLHEEHFGKNAKRVKYAALGEYGYTAQYQQEPVALGGNRIKMHWFRKHNTLPAKFDEIVFSLDTASKGKDINNPSVAEIYGRKEEQWYLIEVARRRLVYPELKRLLVTLEAKYNPNFILIEDKSSGTQLLQEAISLGITTCVPIEPHGDKISRMELEMATVENGTISLPNPLKISCPWMIDFESEIIEFPTCTTIDQIDAFSQFLMWLRVRQDELEVW